MASITIVIQPPHITHKDLVAVQQVANQTGRFTADAFDNQFPGHSFMFCIFIVFPLLILWSYWSTKRQEKKRKAAYESRTRSPMANRYAFQSRFKK